jgi:hypothetical protein
MFMQRIVAQSTGKKKRPLALKIGAGLFFLCLSAVIAPLWFLACAAWFGIHALIRGGATLAVQAWRTTIWAGEAVVGR